MPANMDEIARILGVSKSTVSRALSDKGRISPEMRTKVKKLAEDLDYRPNTVALSFRQCKTSTIGVVAMGIQGMFYAQILEGIERLAFNNDYSVLLTCSHGYSDREICQLDALREKQVEGLVIAPCHPSDNMAYYKKLKKSKTPFVFIDRYMPGLEADCVTTDNYSGGMQAAQHLIKQGRKRFAFLSSTEKEITSVQDRRRGFRDGLAGCGKRLGHIIGNETQHIWPPQEFARQAVCSFLSAGNRADAVFAANDELAMGCIRALFENGLQVPDDVSVVGFDDSDFAAYFLPSITTLRQSSEQIGEMSMRLLLDKIDKKQHDNRPSQILLKPELIARESS